MNHRLALTLLLLFASGTVPAAWALEPPVANVATLAPETLTVPGTHGISLFQRVWRPAGRPRGVLVVVHGLKDHGGRYGPLAEHLVGLGYEVIACDLRGHGRSGGERVWVDSFDDYLADLGGCLGWARHDAPRTPVFVLGHSMGGAIATLYALRHPGDLQGLLLSAPALKPGSDVSPLLASATGILGTLAPHLAVMDLDDRYFSRDPKVVAAMATDPLITDRPAPAHTAEELLEAIGTIQGQMAAVMLPVLLMHGTGDRITNPEGSRELYQRAMSPDKTLKLYDGLYHDLLHEPEHERVVDDLTAWLNDHTRS